MVDWQRIWNDDKKISCFSPLRATLFFLSLFYRLIVNLRNWLYNKQLISSVRLPCPVISVGNITVGGTGKTPCVIMLSQMLQAAGYRPAVISRGYGGKSAQKINIVSDGRKILLDSETAGDEPLLIAQLLPGVPVITGAKRIRTGNMAIKRFGADVIVCDDAFQHRKISRDIDLVLLDSAKPLGNGHLLPAGELREPLKELKRTDCLIMTRAHGDVKMSEEINQIAQKMNIPIFYSNHYPQDIARGDGSSTVGLEVLTGKSVCAFCGIACPDSFEEMLRKAGTQILSFNAFPDHYRYGLYDLEELNNQYMKLRADYLMTTHKDAVRLHNYPEFLKAVWILRIKMKMRPSSMEDSFEKFILRRLKTGAGQ